VLEKPDVCALTTAVPMFSLHAPMNIAFAVVVVTALNVAGVVVLVLVVPCASIGVVVLTPV
jgi:hypothetical protein